MEIYFQTKAESNRQQREEFLKLSGGERVQAFFELCERMAEFPVKNKSKRKNDNFIIDLSNDSTMEK